MAPPCFPPSCFCLTLIQAFPVSAQVDYTERIEKACKSIERLHLKPDVLSTKLPLNLIRPSLVPDWPMFETPTIWLHATFCPLRILNREREDDYKYWYHKSIPDWWASIPKHFTKYWLEDLSATLISTPEKLYPVAEVGTPKAVSIHQLHRRILRPHTLPWPMNKGKRKELTVRRGLYCESTTSQWGAPRSLWTLNTRIN